MEKIKTIIPKICIAIACAALFATTAMAADSTEFGDGADTVVNLILAMVNPALALVGALASVYSIVLGVKYAKVADPQEREKEKAHIKNIIIGFFLIFILILSMKLTIPIMKNWAAEQIIQKELQGF